SSGEDNWNRCRCFLCSLDCNGISVNQGHLATNQIGGQSRQSIVLVLRETVFNRDVLAFDIARFFQALEQLSLRSRLFRHEKPYQPLSPSITRMATAECLLMSSAKSMMRISKRSKKRRIKSIQSGPPIPTSK